MVRLMLNEERWSKLSEVLRQHKIYNKPSLRMMVVGILYRMRTGCPWRDLPSEFGHWGTVYQKFNRWSLTNKIISIFQMLIQDPDCEWGFIDGSIVRAHQHSSGAAAEGYDSDTLRDLIRVKHSVPVIPRKCNSKTGNADMDWCLYKYRHLVENIFARLKHFRAIATRYDKLKRNYGAILAMACAYLWLPM